LPRPEFSKLGISEATSTTAPLDQSIECNWGYAPHYFNDREWRTRGASTPLIVRRQTSVSVHGWALAPGSTKPALQVVVHMDGKEMARTSTGAFIRTDSAELVHDPEAAPSGFNATFVTDSPVVPSSIRALVLDTRGQLLSVDSPRARGHVDGIDVTPNVTTLTPQSGTTLRHYRWIELTSRKPLRNARVSISDGSKITGRAISFLTPPDGGRTYRVRVGACPAWYTQALGGRPLVVRISKGDLVSARLVV